VKLLISITATSGLFALCAVASTAAEPKKKSATVPPASSQMTLLATRKMLIERKKASREHLKNSLALDEDTLEKQMADHEIKRGLYQWELISKSEIEKSEQVLGYTRLEIERIREWIAEDDVALSLTEEAA
jgi:hypothetical protein